eukprot:EG_transcript_63551
MAHASGACSRAKLNQLWAALERLCIMEATTWDFEWQIGELGTAGVKVMTEVLRSATAVHTLELRGNEMRDEGVKVLAEALKRNATLQVLTLACNNVGDE